VAEPSAERGVVATAGVDHLLVERARAFADEVLFPNALQVDNSATVPRANLDLLTIEGLYGLVGPTELGGAGASHASQLLVIEAMAGGCLNTAFVWTQHQGATNAAVNSDGPANAEWAERLSRGTTKAGVAFAHLLRPAAALTAQRVDGGWLLSGDAPWVTGWGYIDVILVAARTSGVNDDVDKADTGDAIVWSLVEASAATTLVPRRLSLSAVDASGTVEIRFRSHFVPDHRVTSIQAYAEWRADYQKGLRVNGSLGLGIAGRTARLLGSSAFDQALHQARTDLDAASVEGMPLARGRLGALTVRMTAALVAQTGGRSVLADQHGQRLAREAIFLLIQGQTPEIRDAQLANLLT
jgi:alkylation response protein AidB-like acyl-CoA dehydrogenase